MAPTPLKSLQRMLASLSHGVLELALPRVCVVCATLLGERRGMVCAACWGRVPVLPHPRCDRCGHPTGDDECRWCPALPRAVGFARSVCWVPAGTGGELVHALKYGGWRGLARDMGVRMARACGPPPCRAGGTDGSARADRATAFVVPVPLGAERQRQRGFNQSAELAAVLGREWRMRVSETVIVRRRETASQVLLTPGQRSANVHGAFAAGCGADAVRGGHVVLVDDVVTTAATLNACAAVVLAAGASTISYVTFGRARAAFDRTTRIRSE